MRKLSIVVMGLLLASCGGGKGCGPRQTSSPITIYEDFYFLELGELTPDKIKNGILTIEATMPDNEKERLGQFLKNAEATGNIDDSNIQYVHVSGYIEHEDHLHGDFVYGSEVYDYSKYICSEIRLFTDNSVFPKFEQGLPFSIGSRADHLIRTESYEIGDVGSEQTSYHNPSGYATYPVPEFGVQDDDFYKGDFKIRVEAGTSITEDNIPEGKFYLRLYLRMAIARNLQVNLIYYDKTTPLCGPYAPEVDMTTDMPINDMTHDMNDMDASDMTHDMNINDMSIDSSDMSSDLSMD